jgi:hypothetical protein
MQDLTREFRITFWVSSVSFARDRSVQIAMMAAVAMVGAALIGLRR